METKSRHHQLQTSLYFLQFPVKVPLSLQREKGRRKSRSKSFHAVTAPSTTKSCIISFIEKVATHIARVLFLAAIQKSRSQVQPSTSWRVNIPTRCRPRGKREKSPWSLSSTRECINSARRKIFQRNARARCLPEFYGGALSLPLSVSPSSYLARSAPTFTHRTSRSLVSLSRPFGC